MGRSLYRCLTAQDHYDRSQGAVKQEAFGANSGAPRDQLSFLVGYASPRDACDAYSTAHPDVSLVGVCELDEADVLNPCEVSGLELRIDPDPTEALGEHHVLLTGIPTGPADRRQMRKDLAKIANRRRCGIHLTP